MELLTAMGLFGYSLSAILLFVGVALIVAEAIVPGAHFIVLGSAAFVSGLIGLFTPAGSSVIALTAVFIISSVAVYLVYSRFDLYGGDGSGVGSSDSDDFIGKEGTVVSVINSTSGSVKLDDTSGFTSTYEARASEEIEIDERVVVTDGRGGSVLEVERMDSGDESSDDQSSDDHPEK